MRTTTKRIRRSVAGILAVVLIGACAGQDGPDADTGPDAETLDGEWTLVEGTGPDGDIPVVDEQRPTLTIDGQRWGGTVCNQYSTTATLDGGQVQLDGVVATEMACVGDGIMEAEAAYLDAFGQVTRVEIVDSQLVLEGEDVELVYAPVEPEAAASTGTT